VLVFDTVILNTRLCCASEVGRKKVAECGMMPEIVRLVSDDGVGAELQETVLDLLASLCDTGKFKQSKINKTIL